jgi:hypothetical protein
MGNNVSLKPITLHTGVLRPIQYFFSNRESSGENLRNLALATISILLAMELHSFNAKQVFIAASLQKSHLSTERPIHVMAT